MSLVVYEEETIQELGDAVREVTGDEQPMTVNEMTNALRSYTPTGGSGPSVYSEGLEFQPEEYDYGYGYILTGRGTCPDYVINVPPFYKGEPVFIIGTRAFYGDKKLTSIIIPDTVEKIKDEAFYNSALASVVLSKNLEEIGMNAFRACALHQVELPKSLKTIGDRAFVGNYAIRELTIPYNVSYVGQNVVGPNTSYDDAMEISYNSSTISCVLKFEAPLVRYKNRNENTYLNYFGRPGVYWGCDPTYSIFELADCDIEDTESDRYYDYCISEYGEYLITGYASIIVDVYRYQGNNIWHSYEEELYFTGAGPDFLVLKVEEKLDNMPYDDLDTIYPTCRCSIYEEGGVILNQVEVPACFCVRLLGNDTCSGAHARVKRRMR